MGKYLVRSLKYLLFLIILFSIIVLIIFYTGQHDPTLRPWDLFRGNERQLIIFFVAIALVYPAVGYWKKEVSVGEGFMEKKPTTLSRLNELHFELADEKENELVFRHRSWFIRLMRIFCDKITIVYNETEGKITIEGLRKDVARVANYLSWGFKDDNQERTE